MKGFELSYKSGGALRVGDMQARELIARVCQEDRLHQVEGVTLGGSGLLGGCRVKPA